MILLEENWKMYLPHDEVEESIGEIIKDAKQGNPFAAVYLANKLGRGGYGSQFENQSYSFWLRVADTLARPGWGTGIKGINSEIRQNGLDFAIAAIAGHNQDSGGANHEYVYRKGSVLNDPMSLYMEGARFRAATQGYSAMLSKGGYDFLVSRDMDIAYVWLREACMRGDVAGCQKFALYYTGGMSDQEPTKDLSKAYAAAQLGFEISGHERHNAFLINFISGVAQRIYTGFTTPEQKAEAAAALEAMRQEYEQYRGKVLAEQRARRDAILPEIQRQIEDWEKDAISTRNKRW